MQAEKLIEKYYSGQGELLELLLRHSRDVRDKALEAARRHPELGLDTGFVAEAAMLHDIGVIFTDAPGIHCYGSAPYLYHGLLGGALIRQLAKAGEIPTDKAEAYARVCERHTGAGITAGELMKAGGDSWLVKGSATIEVGRVITAETVINTATDFFPETTEEKLICWADKFFSKSKPEREKTTEQAIKSLAKFGQEGVERFKEWNEQFGN